MNPDSHIDPGFPLCELHRHLDGSVRLETLLDLADRHGIDLPGDSVASLRPHVQVIDPADGLMAFIAKFQWLTAVLVDTDACRRVARENVHDAAHEGIDYIELRFSPWFMAETHGLQPQAVVEAVIDGVRAGADETGVDARVIGILSRTYGVETCHRELDALLACADGLTAVDLAGDEKGFPARLFREHFDRVRDAGLHVTIHAGEADGPDSVRAAIEDLGAERIGHGILAVRDPAVVELLAMRGIGLEVCLTSNLHTSVVSDYRDHPLGDLMAHGVNACLNTDDPGISGIDLAHEYDVAAPAAGLDRSAIHRLQRQALEMAFISDDERQNLRARAAADDTSHAS
ncbi:adenosine deaminase [Elongatibacter sediminis]|uniref:adenosine deaminase n=1 Tax=Elongatibacter sediminis TaxID=3119006 RepID=A0AAW9R6Y1_9GAMM